MPVAKIHVLEGRYDERRLTSPLISIFSIRKSVSPGPACPSEPAGPGGRPRRCPSSPYNDARITTAVDPAQALEAALTKEISICALFSSRLTATLSRLLSMSTFPRPKLPARTRSSSASNFPPSTPATYCSQMASMHCAPRFQPSSAMKLSAAFSMWVQGCRTSSSATRSWRRSPASPGGSEWSFLPTAFSPCLLTRTRGSWRCWPSIPRPPRCCSASMSI